METGNVMNEAMKNEGMLCTIGIDWIDREREREREIGKIDRWIR